MYPNKMFLFPLNDVNTGNMIQHNKAQSVVLGRGVCLAVSVISQLIG